MHRTSNIRGHAWSGVLAAAFAGAMPLSSAAFAESAAALVVDCPGDLNGDGVVQSLDITALLSDWGGPPSDAIASDIDGSGIVDARDLAWLINAWGPCPQVSLWATVLEASPDPAVVTDPALRAAIEASGLAWRVRDRGSGVEMLLVPAGSFMMGASEGDAMAFPDEFPAHLVTISRPFYLGRYEITQREYETTMENNPSWNTENLDPENNPLRPVESTPMDWVAVYLSLTGLRLPTEAEWEFACRAGTTTPIYATGTQTLDSIAWFTDNSGGHTHAVGGKAANALGFHDMLGNVWEWNSDWVGPYSPAAQTDPQGPASGTVRVIRGRSWGDFGFLMRSSGRADAGPNYSDFYDGFRVARNP